MEKIHQKMKQLKKNLWIDTDTLFNSKKKRRFSVHKQKGFFLGLKLRWIRKYALNKINDH